MSGFSSHTRQRRAIIPIADSSDLAIRSQENGELKAGASGDPTTKTLARERVSNSARIVHIGPADHGTRFFNVPDLTSSVKRRLLARARRRFARSAVATCGLCSWE